MSLRRNIVERVLKLYHVTSRNLTIVNDNLSKAQGIVEVKIIGSYIYGLYIGERVCPERKTWYRRLLVLQLCVSFAESEYPTKAQ